MASWNFLPYRHRRDRVPLQHRPARLGTGTYCCRYCHQRRQAEVPGLHSLRHFYASWCINRVEDGGLGLPIKMVRERMGHSTLAMTADRYGHLFPSGDDGAELAKAEKLFFS